MKVTERHFKRALRNATSFLIARYLMANSHGRLDGHEKAERHRDLCLIFVSALCDIPIDEVRRQRNEPKYQAVHTETQQLTGYLDREIGFPLTSHPDYDVLEPKFFNRFYQLAVKALAKKRRTREHR
jgi:hypothetical protein